MSILIQFLVGLLFGLGLIVAGMSDPAKVLGFLDLGAIPQGTWDPSLVFVMAGGIGVTLIGYRLVLGRGRPLLAARFALPSANRPDLRLVTGAALFGLGWGLAGFCPGPALVSVLTGGPLALVFLAAMLVGMALARRLAATPELPPVAPAHRN
ncbi:YeeE/YedE family protein [Bosea sp. ANAM02]|uniref:YeeE/YedE family protein n=1 Tax=Bosea sp. ANAM02 TaxID=2020412 RepID=UPI0006464779|nr:MULTISPECIES: YeeE/YedE family protein [Hyphomicrobiales]BCB20204.1 membrane protein [Bosea sp. ANAM02]